MYANTPHIRIVTNKQTPNPTRAIENETYRCVPSEQDAALVVVALVLAIDVHAAVDVLHEIVNLGGVEAANNLGDVGALSGGEDGQDDRNALVLLFVRCPFKFKAVVGMSEMFKSSYSSTSKLNK